MRAEIVLSRTIPWMDHPYPMTARIMHHLNLEAHLLRPPAFCDRRENQSKIKVTSHGNCWTVSLPVQRKRAIEKMRLQVESDGRILAVMDRDDPNPCIRCG